MVEQTYAPVSRVDIDKLYVDSMAPESWLELEVRAVELLENGNIAEDQSRALVWGLRTLAERGELVPESSGDLYLRMRPVLDKVPEPYA